jgi:hypothetical protein
MQTERDAEIVSWLGRIGAASAEHVMARFGMGRSSAYACLSRLGGDGLLEHKQLLYRTPGLYIATAEGLRWTFQERLGIYRLGPGGFQHAWELATTAVALHRSLPGWQLLSECEIRVGENEGPELIASASLGELPGGRPALHRPDLVLIGPDERVLAIEVELSIKAPRRLQTICRGYARARHVDHVYYLQLHGERDLVTGIGIGNRAQSARSLRSTDQLLVQCGAVCVRATARCRSCGSSSSW